MSENRKTAKTGVSYPNKLLKALQHIYEDDNASIPERLQAIKISVDVLPLRPPVKRKTDKDKAILEALGKSNPKKKFGPTKKASPKADPVPETGE